MRVREAKPSWQLVRIIFIAFLACTWLLPNHTEPWKVFVSEAWISAALLLASFCVFSRTRFTVVPVAPVFLGMLAVVPWVQHAAGLLPWAGQATIASTFLLAAALAWTLGYAAQGVSASQVGDTLFTALGAAAVGSTGLALYQWLGVADPTSLNIWVVNGAYSGRAVGNLGQPNQLGTLMVLGVLAAAWAVWRGSVRGWAGWAMAGFCLVGVVMTQSRTAVLELAMLVAAAWYWRRRCPNRNFPLQATLGFLIFVVLFSQIRWFEEILSIDTQFSLADRLQTELRPMQWRMFVDGLMHSPWWGYGWNLVTPAQFAADYYPKALWSFNFGQSHNIFLDILLWVGIPFGAWICGILVFWYWRMFRRLRQDTEILYFLALSIWILHSMLEYPLEYLYYLIPFAVFAGALNRLQGGFAPLRIPRMGAVLLLGLGSTLWYVLLSDCLEIERRYLSLRLSLSGIRNTQPQETPPPIRLMDQMAVMIEYAGTDIHADVTDEELDTMRGLANFYASPKNLLTYSASLALRGDIVGGQAWLDKTCRVVPVEHCKAIPTRWAAYQKQFPALLAVNPR